MKIAITNNDNYAEMMTSQLLGFASVSHLWDFCIKKVGMNPTEIRSQKE